LLFKTDHNLKIIENKNKKKLKKKKKKKKKKNKKKRKKKRTYLGTNLVTALTCLYVDNFTHIERFGGMT
jgi:ribosomal protein S4